MKANLNFTNSFAKAYKERFPAASIIDTVKDMIRSNVLERISPQVYTDTSGSPRFSEAGRQLYCSGNTI